MSVASASQCGRKRWRVAVIVTCHNRKAVTQRCLAALRMQKTEECDLALFLTDDGSTDGTAEMVRAIWPAATILEGTGKLYWAAGMAMAEQAAIKVGFDYLLWLNDDTVLDRDAIAKLLECSRRNPFAIVVGAVRCPSSKKITYGVRRRVDWHPQRFALVGESAGDASGDTFNGNCVLISAAVRDEVGNIDGKFPHAYADDDYGLRASRVGIPVIQSAGTIGTCPANQLSARKVRGFWRRLRALESPKGLPWKAQVRFLRRHGGVLWPVILLGGYLKRLLKG
jgi:GT2 family glycosyltransferase